jgi:hypothetical protein
MVRELVQVPGRTDQEDQARLPPAVLVQASDSSSALFPPHSVATSPVDATVACGWIVLRAVGVFRVATSCLPIGFW